MQNKTPIVIDVNLGNISIKSPATKSKHPSVNTKFKNFFSGILSPFLVNLQQFIKNFILFLYNFK